MADRLTTGIEDLDRELGGGLRGGSVVALETSPAGQGELLLRELAAAHDTLYLSTTRTEAAVREWLSSTIGDDASTIDVRHIDSEGVPTRPDAVLRNRLSEAAGWSPVDDADPGASEAEPASPIGSISAAVTASAYDCVVIDPVNPLERGDEETYLDFLHGLQHHLAMTGGIATLHVVETTDPPGARWLTLQMADEVWDVTVDVKGGQVNFRLSVTKSRAGSVTDRQIKLLMETDVVIDTSRDIA